MNDKPRKTLSLKRNDTVTHTHAEKIEHPVNNFTPRPSKRLIKREELSDLQRPGRDKSKAFNKSNVTAKKRPFKTEQDDLNHEAEQPSAQQARRLNVFLNKASKTWRDHCPLILGIEAELGHFLQDYVEPPSRRVLQRVLYYQTNNKRYLMQVLNGEYRYHLDGSIGGEIRAEDKEHAQRALTRLTNSTSPA